MLQKLVFYIFRLISFAVKRMNFAGKGIPVEDKFTDFIEIFRSTRIYFLFNILALLVFILLPQGKDVILIVIEDLSNFHPGSLISLLIGLTGWSVVSEFGARYKIYITDNSGKSLSDERVNFRQEAQKITSTLYLLLPVLIVMLSVIIVSAGSIKTWSWHEIWPFVTVMILLFLTFAGLSKFYLDEEYIDELRQGNFWFKVRKVELDWVNKLYGIYTDHVLMIRKAQNFKDDSPDPNLKNTYTRFTEILESLPEKADEKNLNSQVSFPKDYIIKAELAPDEFNEVEYKPDNYKIKFDKEKNKFIKIPNEDGYYRWIYTNKPSFFKTIHLQVKVIAISSLILLLIISTGSLISYEFIGSPGLVCLSFACWLGIYTGLLYIDSRYRKQIKISVRWLLVLWFFIVSYINKDHPVRMNISSGSYTTQRPTLDSHFTAWFNRHKADTKYHLWVNDKGMADTVMADSSKIDSNKKYPVFFITAEGGALRTGAFTALLLAKLQDSFPAFKHNIYAFSSVSGGSVGISFFNAISFLAPNPDTGVRNSQAVTRIFFGQDQLSPVLAKMFYADVLNDFWPVPVENFDRAIALEKTWEHSYNVAFKGPNDRNIFSSDFVNAGQTNPSPAWFINTTEVETGLQCYLSNVNASRFLFAKDRDLLQNKVRGSINYSTAVNFSSRFPLFSPSAALRQNDDQTYHYVDGGYVENTGAKTMLEVLQSLQSSIRAYRVQPYVIQIRFGDSTQFQKTGFLNEISSIFNGIYNTRAGSSDTYTELLRREVDSLDGQFIRVPLPATSSEIPMSWVFSKKSLQNLDSVINRTFTDPHNDLHKMLPFFQKNLHLSLNNY